MKGIGESQIIQFINAETEILKVLMDSKPHRYKEIVKKTGLSTATVSKHLKRLEEKGWVKKEVDLKSNIYPYPVLYTLNSSGIKIIEMKNILKKMIEEINNSQLLWSLLQYIKENL